MKNVVIVVLDTETTGLDTKTAAIVDVAAVPMIVQDQRIEILLDAFSTFSRRVYPGDTFFIDEENNPAFKVNKLSKALLKDQLTTLEVANMLKSYLQKIKERYNKPLIGASYNWSFDYGMLKREPWAIGSHLEGQICIMVSAAKALRTKWMALDKAAGYYDLEPIPEDLRHTALGDAVQAAKILERLLK